MTQAFRPAGHLVQRTPGAEPEGEPGTGYDYIMAGNGLFVRARNALLDATVQMATAEIRGLPPLEAGATLAHGPVPMGLLQAALRAMRLAAPSELMAVVVHDPDAGYQLRYPPQSTGATRVEYEALPGGILEIHSHVDGSARFSHTDDQDERGLAIYGVVGRLSSRPEVSLRLGVYGNFQKLPVSAVFASAPTQQE